jgi:hypothetical protein
MFAYGGDISWVVVSGVVRIFGQLASFIHDHTPNHYRNKHEYSERSLTHTISCYKSNGLTHALMAKHCSTLKPLAGLTLY